MMHWLVKYLNLRYEPGGRGPEKVDCWGLVYLIYKQEFGLELPLLPGVGLGSLHEARSVIEEMVGKDWEEMSPFEGAVVGMSQNNALHHVGVYTSKYGGKVIHAHSSASSIVAEPLWILRFKGFRTIKFYKHREWPTLSK